MKTSKNETPIFELKIGLSTYRIGKIGRRYYQKIQIEIGLERFRTIKTELSELQAIQQMDWIRAKYNIHEGV